MSADYKIDTVDGAARNLAALISAICEIQFNLSVGGADERIGSLLWIARDLADGLCELATGVAKEPEREDA
jgi:hypothetical protein